MTPSPHDALNAAHIRSLLGETAQHIRVDVYPQIDSTNNEAKRRARAGDISPTLIVADTQTGGRGRLGRTFFSPVGAGIYMTYLWHPDTAAVDAVSVTTAASVAVVRALKSFVALQDADLRIKWVNDIYLSGKKLCGILTEAVTDAGSGRVSALLVGIGINVRPAAFPPELADIATSLGDLAPARNELIARIVIELRKVLDASDPYAHMSDYRAYSLVIGKQVNTIRGDTVTPGIVLNIDPTGGLIVQRVDGSVETIHSGEVSLRLDE